MPEGTPKHKVVIVGGGFGGLLAAQGLKKQPVEVTVIDRRNFHLFQPLLYQVATGALSPANIAAPLRSVLRKQRNTRVLLGEVTGFDISAKSVQLKDGTAILLRPRSSSRPVRRTTTSATTSAGGSRPDSRRLRTRSEIRRRVLSAFGAPNVRPTGLHARDS